MGYTDKNTHQLWKLAFFAGLCGGIGGISIDLDHILNMATGGMVPWTMFHAPVVALAIAILCSGCFVALIGGLLSSLVLDLKQRRNQSAPFV